MARRSVSHRKCSFPSQRSAEKVGQDGSKTGQVSAKMGQGLLTSSSTSPDRLSVTLAFDIATPTAQASTSHRATKEASLSSGTGLSSPSSDTDSAAASCSSVRLRLPRYLAAMRVPVRSYARHWPVPRSVRYR